MNRSLSSHLRSGVAVLGVCLTCALPVGAQTTTSAGGATTPGSTGSTTMTTTERRDNDRHDYGWLGLVGLAGLLGLRRKHEDIDVRTRSSTGTTAR